MNNETLKKRLAVAEAIGKSCREFVDANGLVKAISRTWIVMSWGAHAWQMYGKKVMSFQVNGHHYKGYILLSVNGADLFDIRFVNSNFEEKMPMIENIYLEDLIRVIDEKIEKIASYKH